MTETAQKTQLTESTWAAIIALLSPAYPDITRNDLQKALDGAKADEKYVTVAEACKILSVSSMTLRRWEHRGKLSGKRLTARKVLYPLSQIRGMLA